ncbi:MAG: carboxypeptidase regulatory-like domain-containing protein [Acidobacteria bacterium]|nr:carboxypeptidase regulatory-like domain-containing protein [Acidobacteriota bacterium]
MKLQNKYVLLIVFLALVTPLMSQQNTATISGRVLDSSAAVVPGATVVATNVQTGIARSAITNETGTYTIPLLQIGQYDVSAELAGFKKAVKSGIVLQVGQQAR